MEMTGFATKEHRGHQGIRVSVIFVFFVIFCGNSLDEG